MRSAMAAPVRPASGRTCSLWAWARVLGGVGILALLVWRVGTSPFLHGLRAVDGFALVAAFGLGAVTTVCCAWRWRLIAAGLGVRLSLGAAVGAYYRSQFLNTTLPGGVVGDVHRAVRHGLDIGDVGLAVRSVVFDRLAGQVVQAAIAVIVLFALPSPVRSHMPVVTIGAVAFGVALVLGVRAVARGRSWRWMRLVEIGDGLLSRRVWTPVVLLSTVVVAGHVATFLLAARRAGSTAPMTLLVPLALLALLAMGLPVNVAGWGPRESVAAWAFGAAGLTVTQGVATAVTYGVLVLFASLPGAAVLVARWLSREPAVRVPTYPAHSRVPALGQGDAGG